MGGGGECTAHIQGMRGGLRSGVGVGVATARSPPSTPTDAEKRCRSDARGPPDSRQRSEGSVGGGGGLMLRVCGFLLTEGAPWFQRGH